MFDFVRVKDKATGEELSVRRPNLSKFDVLDKPAVDRFGRRLPNKPKTSVSAKPAEQKKTPTNGAEPATTPEEGSK